MISFNIYFRVVLMNAEQSILTNIRNSNFDYNHLLSIQMSERFEHLGKLGNVKRSLVKFLESNSQELASDVKTIITCLKDGKVMSGETKNLYYAIQATEDKVSTDIINDVLGGSIGRVTIHLCGICEHKAEILVRHKQSPWGFYILLNDFDISEHNLKNILANVYANQVIRDNHNASHDLNIITPTTLQLRFDQANFIEHVYIPRPFRDAKTMYDVCEVHYDLGDKCIDTRMVTSYKSHGRVAACQLFAFNPKSEHLYRSLLLPETAPAIGVLRLVQLVKEISNDG